MNTKLHIEWLSQWHERVGAAGSIDGVRELHDGLWSTWLDCGAVSASGINKDLRLDGDDMMQPDMPHLFAGRPEDATIMFVNINPGWDKAANAVEDQIVRQSEASAWNFSRDLFTQYPKHVGPMKWWSQAIGLAWRIMHGSSPDDVSAEAKQSWALSYVAGWELFPLHSKRAGFLKQLGRGRTGQLVNKCMRAALELALGFPVPVVVVASDIGATMTNMIAVQARWPVVAHGRSLPEETRVYRVDDRLIVSLPRQIVSSYESLAFEPVAREIRRLGFRGGLGVTAG